MDEDVLVKSSEEAKGFLASMVVDEEVDVKDQKPAPARKVPVSLCFCGRYHSLVHCSYFKACNAERRLHKVIGLGLCCNCFANTHRTALCTSANRCGVCGDRHHTMIHNDQKKESRPAKQEKKARPVKQENRAQKEKQNGGKPKALTSTSARNRMMPISRTQPLVLLPTAQCFLICGSRCIKVRTLVDLCATTSTISREVLRSARIRRDVGDVVDVVLAAHHDKNIRVDITIQVVKTISRKTPSSMVSQEHLDRLCCYKLADETFRIPGSIQLILNSEFYSPVMLANNHRPPGLPTIMQTKFGCLLCGSF